MTKLQLTAVEVAQHLTDAGFRSWQIVRMGQIAMAESALNAYAVNVVDNPTSPAHLSLDVGLLQINTYWNGLTLDDVTRMFDPADCCAKAFDIFKARGGLRDPRLGYAAWSAYNNGAYHQFQQQAVDAARTVGQWP